MNDVRRVLVIGGGVGGLAAATALAQRGADVLLIEKQATFDLPGVGLGQPANALRVYRNLDVLDEVLDGGFIYNTMDYFDKDRNLVVQHKFLLGDDSTPAVCALTRVRLHQILRDAAVSAGAEIRLNTTATEMNDSPDGVHVVFSDGGSDTFDVVVGFDGIRSSTRSHIFGEAFVPRPTGYGAWRVQHPRPDYVKSMEFLQGIGSKTGAMPLDDDLLYLFHIRPEDPDVWIEHDTLVDNLRQRLEGYGSYVAEARDGLTAQSNVVFSPLEVLLIPGPWHSGRIVLGGDAAHVVPPHLTQGAGLAVEDAVVLAQELRGEGTVEEKLNRYAERRYARAAFVLTFARQMLDDEQSARSPQAYERVLRDTALYGSQRIAVSDRILNTPVIHERALV
ncbi:FAD-dependent oxidoreductase [Homoserinimonas sp. OAct 916]|uniref:FAD-dependent oxidoreductase n=1 Tax=Homoserinimonas sp. OAct 916 TaxID=2211450 RepID=UPI0018E59987|nr:FAD-dependent oxidoreductase [Homoserinimonas sp. OAct 916]